MKREKIYRAREAFEELVAGVPMEFGGGKAEGFGDVGEEEDDYCE